MTKSALPRYSCTSVAHVSIHKGHYCQDATHLGVGVSRNHLEYVVVEGVKVLLGDLPQLRGNVGVQVLGSFVPDSLTLGLEFGSEPGHDLLLLLLLQLLFSYLKQLIFVNLL